MYLYNISIIVEDNSHDLLLEWVQNNWLPSLAAEAKFLKMLNTPHEGHTYCVQLVVKNESEIVDFQENDMQSLQEHISQNHLEKAFIFDSIMQYL